MIAIRSKLPHSVLRSSPRCQNLRLPQPFLLKQFSSHVNPVLGSDNAYATTDARGFDKRERSEESRYAKEKEAAELKKLREELARQSAKIEELEKSIQSKK